jgi:hypothetical protein
MESMIPIPHDEYEELQEVLEVLNREAEFQRRVGDCYEHVG